MLTMVTNVCLDAEVSAEHNHSTLDLFPCKDTALVCEVLRTKSLNDMEISQV